MRSLAYLDQNVVIDLQERARAGEKSPFEKLGRGDAFRVVLSPVHWYEAARARDDQTARQMAEFYDCLQALWLRERIDLQKREIQAYLDNRAQDIRLIEPIGNSTSEIGSGIAGIRGQYALMSSSDIVHTLRHSPQSKELIRKAYSNNEAAFRADVNDMKLGLLDKQGVWQRYITRLATELGFSERIKEIEGAQPTSFFTINVEYEVEMEHWSRAMEDDSMRLSPSRQSDAMHAIVALPYVDYVITKDDRFRKLAAEVRKRLVFKTADLVGSIAELVQ